MRVNKYEIGKLSVRIVAGAASIAIACTTGFAQVGRTTPAVASRSTLTRSAPINDEGFLAFTWTNFQPPPTAHVSGLVPIHPWINIADAAAKLRALPAGKRFVIIQNMTEDLALQPGDRCVQRSWNLVTRIVPLVVTPQPASANAVAPKYKMRTARRVAAANTKETMVTVTERVAVDTPTAFRGPWLDNGVALVRGRIDALMAELKRLGAEIDCLVIDNETSLHAACFMDSGGALKAIENDPRWPALAASLGLPSVVSDMTWGSNKYFLWTERMSGRFDAALNEAVFVPLRKYYPNASANQYMSGNLTAAVASPDLNGHFDRRRTAGFGTHDTSEFYGWLAPGRITKCSDTSNTDMSWLALRVEVHKIRGMNTSSQRPKCAWIAAKSWQGETWGVVPFANSPMWDELILQLGMNGVRRFNELVIDDYTITGQQNIAKRTADRTALESVLVELEARVGSKGAFAPLTLAQPKWSDNVIASGLRIGETCVWRFSFAPGVGAVRVQMTDGSAATITRQPGRAGAWFTHPQSVGLIMASGASLPTVDIVADLSTQTALDTQ
jgi:hypothetical protein